MYIVIYIFFSHTGKTPVIQEEKDNLSSLISIKQIKWVLISFSTRKKF